MIRFSKRVQFGSIALLFGALVFLANSALGWVGPGSTPPNGNVSAPINVGTTDQVKDGALSVDGLSVFGNSLLYGSGSVIYLNFGEISGTSGYGVRDNAGSLQFKNTGGTWETLQTIINNYITIAGGDSWTKSGSNIYRDTGNVGIRDTSPSSLFSVGTGGLFQVNSAGAIVEGAYISLTGATPIAVVAAGDILSGSSLSTFSYVARYSALYTQASAAAATGNYWNARKSRGTTANPTVVATGDDLLTIRAYGHDGSAFDESSKIVFDTEGTIGAGKIPGVIRFYTASSAGASTQRLHIGSDGQVGIGTASPTEALHVNGTVLAAMFIYSSDRRLKDAITSLTGGLAKIMQLSPVSFTWKNDIESVQAGKRDIGFIAQEVEEIVPEVVHTNREGMKSVDYIKLVPLLVKALQEQQGEIDVLKADIAALKRQR